MFPELRHAVESHLPSKRKKTPSGWISFNAPCCVHNGESADTRGRGGIMFLADGGIQYHCFNCGFKTNYTPGRYLNRKFRQYMMWIGISTTEISKLAMQAMGHAQDIDPKVKELETKVNFAPMQLPDDAVVIKADTEAEKYLQARGLAVTDYLFYESPTMKHRVIVPIAWRGRYIGYVARAYKDSVKPKYYAQVQPGTLFNLDEQNYARKFVILTEGIFDAIMLDAVAILGSEISHQQKLQIELLNKEVIVVPDRDKAGSKLIEQAIEFGWSVSMPPWHDDVKDVNNAVLKYGKVLTMQAILKHRHKTKTKIKLHEKLWLS